MANNKVLLVDDEEQILLSFQRRLKKQFTLDIATSGKQGLEKLDSEGPYAVVVSDYRMPEMDGVHFLKTVKQNHPDVVRIMLTGFADIHTATKAVNQGQVFRFLTKPCPPRDMAEALEQSIRYHNFIISEREVIDLKRWRKSLEQMVAALARLVESRDAYTAGHQQRVALLSVAIGRAMGLEEQTIDTVRLAATIHDIGKVYVPLEFLTKPGSLSPLELDVIHTHPQVGYEILKPIEFESPISRIVLEHHERLDGSGYPQGLIGSEILVESKIITVADVVEAMCSHRPYRPSRGVNKALGEIEQKKGVCYDPEIVDICLELFRKNNFNFQI